MKRITNLSCWESGKQRGNIKTASHSVFYRSTHWFNNNPLNLTERAVYYGKSFNGIRKSAFWLFTEHLNKTLKPRRLCFHLFHLVCLFCRIKMELGRMQCGSGKKPLNVGAGSGSGDGCWISKGLIQRSWWDKSKTNLYACVQFVADGLDLRCDSGASAETRALTSILYVIGFCFGVSLLSSGRKSLKPRFKISSVWSKSVKPWDSPSESCGRRGVLTPVCLHTHKAKRLHTNTDTNALADTQ